MSLRIILTLICVTLVSACDYFDTTAIKNSADNERKLKDLQWALLIPADIPHTDAAAGHAGAEGQQVEAAHTPGTTPATENTGHEAEQPTSTGSEATGTAGDHPLTLPQADTEHADTAAGHDGSTAPPERDESKAVPTTLAVLAVVDNFTLLPVSEDTDPAEQATKIDLAQRRERVVRQELQNVLVSNTMITVVQPNSEQITQAREEISSTNSAAISNSMLPGLAETLGVQHVVTALIDLEGHEVNVVAQHAPDGAIVFQDTLIDWEPVMEVAKGGSTDAEAGAP